MRLIVKSKHNNDLLIVIDKERVHQAVEIDIFGLCIHGHQWSDCASLLCGLLLGKLCCLRLKLDLLVLPFGIF